MTLILITLAVVALLWLTLFLSPAHKVFFRDTLNAATLLPDPAEWPRVTVIVPARNEAAMLPRTIPTICRQDYPDLRVIVIDDQSDDATPQILAQLKSHHPNLDTLRAADRPAGWVGKPWAVTQGVEFAGSLNPEPQTLNPSDLLLFTDADIEYHPLAVRQAVRLLASGPYDLVSLFPQLHFSCAAERIGLTGLVTVLALGYPAGVVNNPKSKQALAAGGFILVRRAAYESVGGHAAVKDQVIEDIHLARVLKSAGHSLHIRLTDDLLTTRMYEDLPDLWEGLAKNAYAGVNHRPDKFIAGSILGLLIAVLPPVYFIVSLVAALLAYPETSRKRWAVVALTALINLLMYAIHRRTIRHFRLPAWHAWLMPLSLGFYQLIAVHSVYQHVFKGGAVWKGRRYGAAAATTATSTPPPATP
jgi:hopene-associated glycosyltransferase HpnB